MAKGTTPKKDKTPDKVPKTKKTVNSIVRDHPLENLVHSRRKRVPTAALLEYLKQKPKAPAKKGTGAAKKKGTTTGTPKKSADKERGRSPSKASASKKAEKSRSRSKSKKSKKSDEGEKGSKSKSPKKALARTRTMADVIADGKKILKGKRPKSKTRSGAKPKKK